MSLSATPPQIAEWMYEKLKAEKYLYQEMIVWQIIEEFGESFTTINMNGNPGIHKDVLAAFNKITGNSVVWVRSERYWRAREQYDEPGRSQPY